MGLSSLGHKLYAGEVSYDFVGRRRVWYTISGILLVIVVGSMLFRGLNLGIEFTGGAEFQLSGQECTVEEARGAVGGVVDSQVIVTVVGDNQLSIRTEPLTVPQSDEVVAALSETCSVPPSDVVVQLVGPTWGSDISQKALTGLLVFLVLVTIFLAIYFEWRMAVAALVALAHDLLLTIGVYSLLGFEVTPATVIGVLTILGYSLYDTVVVFDKVKENTRGIAAQSRVTFSQAANLAVNQMLVRSINTSIVALLPVGAILFVGAGLLGAGTLKDLALALFVGIAAGTYSSIFIATPLLAQLKERDPEMVAVRRRIESRGKAARTGKDVAEAAADARDDDGTDSTLARITVEELPSTAPLSSGERQQPRRRSRSQRKKS